jgi:hypothetical protein
VTVRRLPAVGLAAALLLGGGACGDGSSPATDPAPVPKPKDGTTHVGEAAAAPTRAQVDHAIAQGVAFLVKGQNKDGSWGSPAPTLTVDIYAPGPGAQEAYKVATSGLALAALVEAGGDAADVREAVRKGTDWLVANCRVRRTTIDVLYNTWSHAYALGAFARLLAKEKDEARRAALLKASATCVDMLERFEYVEGGWGYYDFDTQTRNPGNMATSFTTASVLVTLRMAKDQGVEVPKRLVDRAVGVLGRMRNPDGSFAYSWDHRYWPQGGINKIKGSLARTPACFLALRAWGGKVSDAQVATALENLRKEGRFLAIARKYPRPHEAWYQNSGYFAFYGYYYASQLLNVLAPEQRAVEAASMAAYLVPLQEPDGSWWDYQLYGYHKPYGTAYVLMALVRARDSLR